MSSAIEVVVFDVGNVLLEWDPRHLYRSFIPGRFADEAAMEDFLATVATPAWNLSCDLGRPFAEAVAERSARYPEHADLIAAFDARWQEMVPGAIDANVGVLARLQARGVRTWALTNFSAEKWQECLLRFPFLATFEGAVVSAEEGLAKPDPAIYARLLERCGAAPGPACSSMTGPRTPARLPPVACR